MFDKFGNVSASIRLFDLFITLMFRGPYVLLHCALFLCVTLTFIFKPSFAAVAAFVGDFRRVVVPLCSFEVSFLTTSAGFEVADLEVGLKAELLENLIGFVGMVLCALLMLI